MSQATLDYINGQIVTRDYTAEGNVSVKTKLTFGNGFTTTGEVIRDINNFDLAEAQRAADANAVAAMELGMDYALTKAV